jgi:hydrogenase small subunit
MRQMQRRGFLKMAVALAASLSWPTTSVGAVAEALQSIVEGAQPVVWLQGQSCSGCSVSFLNSAYPDVARVITRYISVQYHQTLSAATGDVALGALNRSIEAGGYLLVVEGGVPVAMPEACRVGEEPFTEQLVRAAQGAAAVVALGTCASFGGIPAAPPNPSGSVSVRDHLTRSGVKTAVVSLPGCPTHPDWLVGTIVEYVRSGVPELTPTGCPTAFYGSNIHAHCPQFYNYDAGKFATTFGEDGCLFKLGCMGIRTEADCSMRRWNNKTNWCVEAGAPCIGCARPEFAQRQDFPFYRITENANGEAGE